MDASEVVRRLISMAFDREAAETVSLGDSLELYRALCVGEAKAAAPAHSEEAAETAPVPENVTGAQFKKKTLDRLLAWRTLNGPGCFTRLAAACGKGFDDDKLRQMAAGFKVSLGEWRCVAAALDRLEAAAGETK